MTTQDPVDQIKNRLDVKDVVADYIKVEKSGVNFKARCPFHQEKTPSFFVSPSRQIWRCFGCGEGGDIFTFVQKMEGIEFVDALQRLGQKAGVDVRRQDPKVRSQKNKSLEICELTSKYFHHQLESKNGKLIFKYFESRGINKESIEEFRLGYAPVKSESLIKFLHEKGYEYQDMERAGIAFKSDISGDWLTRFRSRIIFPIFNTPSNVVGFGARALTNELADSMKRQIKRDTAKYINSPQTNIYDKSSILYGLDKAKIAIRQEDVCIIVEGYTDVILVHQEGYKNAVAASGTSLTQGQLDSISRFTNNIITSFDMDVAGDSATRRSIDLAQNMGFDVKVLILEKGKDPADIIVQDKNKWAQALKNAKSVMQFYVDSAFEQFDAAGPEGKREIGRILSPRIANIPSSIEQAHWVNDLASKLKIDQNNVWEEVRKANRSSSRQSRGSSIKSGQIASHQDKKVQIPIQKERKSRRELLAQQILLGVLKDSKLALIAKKEIKDFKNLISLRLLKGALDMKKFELKAFSRELEKEDKLFIDQLLLEAEIKGGDWTEDDFNAILNSYKRVILEKELKELEIQIQSEESNKKHDKLKGLVNIFHKKTLELSKLQ